MCRKPRPITPPPPSPELLAARTAPGTPATTAGDDDDDDDVPDNGAYLHDGTGTQYPARVVATTVGRVQRYKYHIPKYLVY